MAIILMLTLELAIWLLLWPLLTSDAKLSRMALVLNAQNTGCSILPEFVCLSLTSARNTMLPTDSVLLASMDSSSTTELVNWDPTMVSDLSSPQTLAAKNGTGLTKNVSLALTSGSSMLTAFVLPSTTSARPTIVPTDTV